MAASTLQRGEDLPPDNASRIAIYDALYEASQAGGEPTMTVDELFEHVIRRLRLLVPRELHIAGERPYIEEKIKACSEAGLISIGSDKGQRLLALTGRRPFVRYPDGAVRDYSPGLELAGERLDADNTRLRSAGFDVGKYLPSIADDRQGSAFQGLLASMREHGFLKHFPVVRYEDGAVVDGRARLRAAGTLEIDVEYIERKQAAGRLPDSPLSRVLIAVHSNFARLDPGVVDQVYEQVSAVAGRPWSEIAADLDLTRAWRRSIPIEYSPLFDVKLLPFREHDEAKVQVTADSKVMLRSLIEAAGLASYKIDILRDYVPIEAARSSHSPGRKAFFVRAEDLIPGIGTMQRERGEAKLKVDPEWEQIRVWLMNTFGSTGG